MEERIYPTNYKVATKWCNNSYVMCNHITEIDSSVFDNMRFYLDYENSDEIYQWFISDCSEWDVEFLEENFGLLFSYSELLDCYILCVDHCALHGIMFTVQPRARLHKEN